MYIVLPPLLSSSSPQLWSGVRSWNYTSPKASFNATLKVSYSDKQCNWLDSRTSDVSLHINGWTKWVRLSANSGRLSSLKSLITFIYAYSHIVCCKKLRSKVAQDSLLTQLAIYKRSRVHCVNCYVIVSTSCHGYNFTYLLTNSFSM